MLEGRRIVLTLLTVLEEIGFQIAVVCQHLCRKGNRINICPSVVVTEG